MKDLAVTANPALCSVQTVCNNKVVVLTERVETAGFQNIKKVSLFALFNGLETKSLFDLLRFFYGTGINVTPFNAIGGKKRI